MELLWDLVGAIFRGIAGAFGWGVAEHVLDPVASDDNEDEPAVG